jgi:hypothetical protein
VDLVDIGLLKLIIATLPSNEIPGNQEGDDAERGRGAPVDKRVAEEEVLDNRVIPSAHAKANFKNWPLPELGGQIILLVRVWYKRVIRSHHRNIQVDEVLEEGRFIRSSVSGRY